MTEQEIAALHDAIDSEVEWHLAVRWNERRRQFEISGLAFDMEFTSRVSDIVPRYVHAMLSTLNKDIGRGTIEDVIA